MNVVDSCAWLEYFADGPAASDFAPAIETPERLVVPTLSLFEVYKRMRQLRDESVALDAVGVMLQGQVVELSATLALEAARVSLNEGLPLVDSIILTTARVHDATLWTMDSHFSGMDGVEYREKRRD